MTTETRQFRDARMENAYYWAGQADGWIRNGPNAGITDRCTVDIVAGTPVIVLDSSWNEETTNALVDGLKHDNFPQPIRVRELENETRVFIEPNDDRLVSDYHENWRDFDAIGGFSYE